jgi:hypothetical protein
VSLYITMMKIYVASENFGEIVKIDSGGNQTVSAGNDLSALPYGLAFDANGNLRNGED